MGFEIYQLPTGRYRWVYRSENGRVSAKSDALYGSSDGAEQAIRAFKERVNASGTTKVAQPRGRALFGVLHDRAWIPVVGVVLAALLAGFASYLGATAGVAGDLKVKAAELAFAGNPTVTDIQNRIQVLAALYPTELKEWKDVAKEGPTTNLFPSANAARWAFLQLEMQKVDCPDQVTQLWRELYGPDRVPQQPADTTDTWIRAVKPVLQCPSSSPNVGAMP